MSSEKYFEGLVRDLAMRLAVTSAREFDDVIEACLSRIGRFFEADRVYTAFFSGDRKTLGKTHEWVSDGIAPSPESSREISIEDSGWFAVQVLAQRPVVIEDVARMEPDAASDQRVFARQGIGAFAAVPVFSGHLPLGFLGLDVVGSTRRWEKIEIDRLQTVAEIIVTGLIRHRQALIVREAEERFRIAVMATRDIIFEVSIETGQLWWNQAFEEVLGYAIGDVVPTLEGWLDLVHEEDLLQLRTAMRDSREVRSETTVEHDFRMKRKDGSYASLTARWRLVRGEAGQSDRVIGAISDDTEVRQIQQKLRDSELRSRTIIDSSSDIILILDEQGNISYVNSATKDILGFSPEDLIGRFALELVNPEHRSEIAAQLEELASGRPMKRTQSQIRKANGGWAWMEAVGRNMLSDPVIGGFLVNLRDVTNRVRLERRLRRSQRVAGLGHAATTIAHQFNNALMAILPQIEVLTRAESKEVFDDAIARVRTAIERGRNLTREIQVQANPENTSARDIRIDEFLSALPTRLASLIPDDVILEVIPPRRPSVIRFDELRLVQVFEELAANAISAMPEGGRLRIDGSTRPYADDEVVIRVADSGRGIPAETLENIFDPLYTTRLSQGKGLGLTWVHEALREHDASIEVSSHEGEGAIFHLIFPLKGEPESAAIEKGSRVVLIEDDAAVRAGISTLLRMEGFEVDVLDRGTGAIELVCERDPKVVILDIGLPDYDGVELFHDIRRTRPRQQVIFSTGHGTEERLSFIEADPRSALLVKPWQFSDLIAVMGKLPED